jgi:hypothetical protein
MATISQILTKNSEKRKKKKKTIKYKGVTYRATKASHPA